jgi:hypothetical protein
VAFAAPWVLYAVTLAPTITFEDSGQLITAAATLGISHPSGYPLAALVGQLFTLIPARPLAWRINLASATAAAATCGVLYLLLRGAFLAREPSSGAWARLAALAAAFAAAGGRTFWSQAVVTETYAVNALCLVSIVYAAFRFADTADVRYGYAAAFVAGIALAAHSSSVLISVPAACYVGLRLRRKPGLRAVALAAALVILGAGIYLYLPLRAVREPPLNWGDPRNLARALAHITRHAYGGPKLARLPFLPHHLAELGRFTLREMTPLTAALAVAAAVLAFVRRWPAAVFLAVWAIITGPLAAVWLVLLLQGHQIGEINVWYTPFFMALAALAGVVVFLGGRYKARLVRLAAYVGAAALALAPAGFSFRWNDLRAYYYAEDWGANFLRTIGYNGYNIMFEWGSIGTFETAYLKKVERHRLDHVFVDATGSAYPEYAALAAGRLGGADPRAAREWERSFELSILERTANAPVYYSYERAEVGEAGYTLEPEGVLFRAYRGRHVKTAISPVWGRYVRRGAARLAAAPAGSPLVADDWARETAGRYATMLAREYLQLGDRRRGFALLEAAGAETRGLSESSAEVGNCYLWYGNPRRALYYYDLALAAFPRKGVGDSGFRQHYAKLIANKALAYIWLEDAAAAERTYRESLAAYPDQPDIRECLRPNRINEAVAEVRAVRARAAAEGRTP